MTHLSVLRESELTRGLAERDLAALLPLFEEATHEPGTFVVREGEAGDTLFVLAEGEAAVRKQGGRSAWFREEQIATLRPGQCFGEMAVLEEDIRSATVQAITPCVTLGLRRDQLAALAATDLATYSRFVWNLARVLASRLRVANHALKEFSPGELRAILARAQGR